VLAGLYLGLLGAVVHRHGSDVAGADVPWGLVLALLPLAPVALVADRTVSQGGAAVLVGWGLVMALQGAVAPGSYLVANDVTGWAFTLVGLGLLVAVAVVKPRLRR